MDNRDDLVLVSIVIPAYNESESLPALLEALLPILRRQGSYEIVFVDDGSTDRTLEVIKEHRTVEPNIRYISLSRNFGHQIALRAGLAHARGQCVISMDADLQHPPDLLPKMIARWREGYDVVYTVRSNNPNLSRFKRTTSRLFYRTINSLAGIRIQAGAADFRLVSRRVVEILRGLDEEAFFLRGLLPWLGFRQYELTYSPSSRMHGETKYTLQKMVTLAIEWITSFSVRPLFLSLGIGVLVSLGAFAYSLYAIYMALFTDRVVPGWTSVLVAILWIGGMQLLVLGILGEYISRIFTQVKGRPHYIVKESTDDFERRSTVSATESVPGVMAIRSDGS